MMYMDPVGMYIEFISNRTNKRTNFEFHGSDLRLNKPLYT